MTLPSTNGVLRGLRSRWSRWGRWAVAASLATCASLVLSAACSLDAQGTGPPSNDASSQGGAAGFSSTNEVGGGGSGGSGGASPVCGNGIPEQGEECDDGNLMPGDGCDASCELEPEFVCDTSIVVNPGSSVLTGSTTAQPSHSSSEVCGKGAEAGDVILVLQPAISGKLTLTLEGSFEKALYARTECNSGSELDCVDSADDATFALDVLKDALYFVVVDGVGDAVGDFSLDLLLEGCGDGIVNLAEECDDADNDDSDGCASSCTVQCMSGWTKNPTNKHCYRHYGTDKDWPDAKNACVALGEDFYLATLSTTDEVSFVKAAFNQDNVWIGGHDRFVEDKFEWLTGEPWIYKNDNAPWDGGEPNDGGWFVDEDCVEIYANAKFNDEVCDTKQDYLCEHIPPGLD